MEQYFAKLFDNINHERSLILLLSLTDSNILLQYGFTENEINIIKNIALEKIHRQKSLKEYIAMNLMLN